MWRFAGDVDLIRAGSAPATLVALYNYVGNRAPSQTTRSIIWSDWLVRYQQTRPSVSRMRTRSSMPDAHAGGRIGEMHAALACSTDDPAFDSEDITGEDLAHGISRSAITCAARCSRCSSMSTRGPRKPTHECDIFSTNRSTLPHGFSICVPPDQVAAIRNHGNLSLQKVLVVANDFVITDFEGDLSLPIDARRKKHSPLRDVAVCWCHSNRCAIWRWSEQVARALIARPPESCLQAVACRCDRRISARLSQCSEFDAWIVDGRTGCRSYADADAHGSFAAHPDQGDGKLVCNDARLHRSGCRLTAPSRREALRGLS